MMTINRETFLRWWAIAAMMVTGLLAVTPLEVLQRAATALSAPSILGTAASILIVGTILILVLGFHLRMLYECGFAKGMHHRGLWLTLLILIPLLSAFIYFWVTRSDAYMQHASEKSHQ